MNLVQLAMKEKARVFQGLRTIFATSCCGWHLTIRSCTASLSSAAEISPLLARRA